MWCDNSKKNAFSQSFEGETKLINRQFKYRTLGEMVAMARATGVAPLPTRSGVYTGEEVIPRDEFEKINAQRKLMQSLDSSEQELKKILEDKNREDSAKKEAEIAKKAIESYKASLKATPTPPEID